VKIAFVRLPPWLVYWSLTPGGFWINNFIDMNTVININRHLNICW